MQLDSMFIRNCSNALHVSDTFCIHPQEHLETVLAASGVWHETSTKYDLVRKPSTLDALIVYFTRSHVIHQRLLLQFLSAPEDGCKKRPKHVEHYCSYE